MMYHDISQEQLVKMVTQKVISELENTDDTVPVGISVRHIHLSREHVDLLFGRNYQLTQKKALSQPGQYACEECLTLIGPKNSMSKVRILGPERASSQVELSLTDARGLGVKAPLRSSGDHNGTPGIILRGPNGDLELKQGVIIADRHIHMSPEDAKRFHVQDGDRVEVKIDGPKPGIMGGVMIRVSDKYRLDFHVDTDDGNAFFLEQGQRVTILK